MQPPATAHQSREVGGARMRAAQHLSEGLNEHYVLYTA